MLTSSIFIFAIIYISYQRMKHLCCILILVAGSLIGSFVAKQENRKPISRYVGDNNYTKILKDQLINDEQRSMIAIMFTNSKCQTCDVFEPQLQQIEFIFREQQKIPIFRCDISVNKMLSDKFQIKRFPVVNFVYKRPAFNDQQSPQIQIYKTTQILTSEIIITAKYLKKMLNFLQTKKAITAFIQTLEQIPNNDKIIVNAEKLKEFYHVNQADFFYDLLLDESFNAMPIVPLSGQLFEFYSISNNPEYKTKPQTIIFIALEQEQNRQTLHIPIEKKQMESLIYQNIDIKQIFKSFLLQSAQQFTQSLYIFQQQFFSSLNRQIPIYLAIVDTIWHREQAKKHVMMINRILQNFENEAIIFWIEGQINPQKKVLLGFDKSTRPPMFGRLILAKNQTKKPLKTTNNTPLFTGSDIKTKIRSDLGYGRLLTQKLRIAIQQLGLSNLIEIQNSIELQKGSLKVQFAYCASKCLTNDQVGELEFLIRRFKRFYSNSKMTIMTQTCLINSYSVQDGLYMLLNSKSHLISEKVVSCIEVESKVQEIAKKFASVLNKEKIIPKNFCVPEKQMRDFLINLKQ